MALVITRKPNESFTIRHGEAVARITITQDSRAHFEVTIDAPRSMIVERDNMKKRKDVGDE